MIDATNKDAIFSAIADILEKDFECPREKLAPQALISEDLDLDSIDAVDLIVRLQKMAKIKVRPEDFKQMATLGDVAEVIHKKLSQQQ